MSEHLGERAAALADGQLTGTALDRALGHTAVCAACRAEVEQHRALKVRLASLPAPAARADLARRLVGLSTLTASQPLTRAASVARFDRQQPPGVPLLRPAAAAFGAPLRVDPSGPAARLPTRSLLAGCVAVVALGGGVALAARSDSSGPAGGSGRLVRPSAVQVLQHDRTSRDTVIEDPSLPVVAVVSHPGP